ncbi:MAG TPA: RimK/LysX family protein [Hyphomicrobiaceae bacterium]|nr:RimK/LysX family protein [Hyphomicrobiaceae bacterium]
MMRAVAAPFVIGWEEWVALPDLGLPAIKAKVDTGAKTSALHAFQIEPFGPPSAPMVRFGIHPIPGRDDIEVYCSAPVVDRREVTSSNGEKETRLVIGTRVRIGDRDWPIEVTLTNRQSMAYRMLLGRQAIREDIRVDPSASFLQPKLSYRHYRHLPRQDLVHRALRIALLTRKPDHPSHRRLATAAEARGHVLERLDTARLALVFDPLTAGLALDDAPLPHYDAVIARLGAEDGAFGAAAVRQLELMGSYALNPGDALDRLANPFVTPQVLARMGIPSPVRTLRDADSDGGLRMLRTSTPHLRFLVIGGHVEAVLERRHGKEFDAGQRKLELERTLAARTARALRLGLASVDIVVGEEQPLVVRVSASPALSTFEKVTGARVAEPIIADIEAKVRSWVRRPSAPAHVAETAEAPCPAPDAV